MSKRRPAIVGDVPVRRATAIIEAMHAALKTRCSRRDAGRDLDGRDGADVEKL